MVYLHEVVVPSSAIDGNGHVNNVAFVQWMQDAAVAHSDAVGCSAATVELGATWVVRSHKIEYLRPGFGGEALQVRTWVVSVGKVSSMRKYEAVRGAEVLARGETEWVFVDGATGRPRRIPEGFAGMFGVA